MDSKKRFAYPRENLEKALHEVQEKRCSIRHAAKIYDIPKSTLIDRLREKYKNPGNIGGPTIFTIAEENILVKWIIEMGELGFPVTKSQLLESVTKLVQNLNRENPFKNNQPGKKWYNGFLSRHPEVSKRVPQSLSSCRALVSEENIRNWFSKIRKYLEENNLLDVINDDRRVFNCDESGFYLAPQEKQVLVRKGSKKVYNRTVNDEKECLTVLLTISADGAIPPPLVLFPYKRYVPSSIIVNMPKKWGIGHSESGWMTSETFYEYITNVFHPWLKDNSIPLPVILFLDGHSSHININLSEFCKENGIILTAFYPNATHRLQPLDVGVFYPLKNCWRNDVRQWRMENSGKKMQRSDFSKILQKSLDATVSPLIIKKAFQSCGLFPFTEDAIDYSKLVKQIQNIEENVSVVSPANEGIFSKTQISDSDLLRGVEARLDKSVLEQFKNVYSETELEERYVELYKFWKSLYSDQNLVLNETTFQNNVPNNLNQTISDITIDEQFWFNNDVIEGTVGIDGSLNIVDPQPSTSQDQSENNPASNENGRKEIPNSVMVGQQTPEKNNQGDTPNKNFKYPTPFKNSLFWPENDKKRKADIDNKKGQNKKTKIYPTVAISDEFMEYQRRIEDEKQTKEKDKLDRAKKRRDKLNNQQSNKKSDSNNNNTKIIEDKEKTEEYSKGSYVIVQYEGQFFPGIVIENVDKGLKVKSMMMSGHLWKWPEKDDILIYESSDVICKIQSPTLVSNRGFYNVPEINNLHK